MTYELNNAEGKDKTRKSKEKSTSDNINDEELDNLVILVKKMERFSK